MADAAYRQPPHHVQIEQALLGAILTNNAAFEKIGDFLKAIHFYDPAHQRIFAAIETMIARGQIAEPRTLKNIFDQDAALEKQGGGAYLADLAANAISIINVEDFGRQIFDAFQRRQLIDIGQDLVNESFTQNLETEATQLIEGTEQKLFELANAGQVGRGFIKLNQSLNSAIRAAETAFKRQSHVTGVTTGLRDLDRRLGGLQRSDLIILAGRPGMGKTALATNIAFNAAKAFANSGQTEGAAIGFFTLEMSSEQIATRLLGEYSEVPSDKIRRGDIRGDDFGRFLEVSNFMASIPFYIDDTPALSISGLRTRARRMKRTVPDLGLIVVDYLQLLQGSGNRRDDNRVLEISEITRGLKALAKELHIPIVALSQLSRGVESRDDKRPQLADLRESGSIEQDADVVLFVYREAYYHDQREPKQKEDETPEKFNDRHANWLSRGEQIRNLAEVIIAKNRHGSVGPVQLHFDGRFTRFTDLENQMTRYE
ncbi:MAG: replicative DNA helicase [Alphaproteobacteria bacterium]|nr:replicative DNA helicase [Alphaproteobacteria bacterium]